MKQQQEHMVHQDQYLMDEMDTMEKNQICIYSEQLTLFQQVLHRANAQVASKPEAEKTTNGQVIWLQRHIDALQQENGRLTKSKNKLNKEVADHEVQLTAKESQGTPLHLEN